VRLVDISSAIRERRSIRKFKNQDVPNDTVGKLVDAERSASSAGNIQPWEFIIVRKPETKKRLANVPLDKDPLRKPPLQ
jgi:nitroreductase